MPACYGSVTSVLFRYAAIRSQFNVLTARTGNTERWSCLFQHASWMLKKTTVHPCCTTQSYMSLYLRVQAPIDGAQISTDRFIACRGRVPKAACCVSWVLWWASRQPHGGRRLRLRPGPGIRSSLRRGDGCVTGVSCRNRPAHCPHWVSLVLVFMVKPV